MTVVNIDLFRAAKKKSKRDPTKVTRMTAQEICDEIQKIEEKQKVIVALREALAHAEANLRPDETLGQRPDLLAKYHADLRAKCPASLLAKYYDDLLRYSIAGKNGAHGSA